MRYQKMWEKIERGELVLLDGGVGTELQQRGVAMAPGAWCGPVSLGSQSLLEDIHLDYIRAGAEIITANTYASSRIMLHEAGFESQFEEINTIAIDAALAAREQSGKKEVLIAGSLSHMIPMQAGTDRVVENGPSTAVIAEAFEELATLLLKGGCDLILLEMMYHPGRIELVLDAVRKTGLPIWAGFSLRGDEAGNMYSFGGPEFAADELFKSIDPGLVDVMGLMHMDARLIGPGLEILKNTWNGPISAYPDSGYFKMPDWQFEKIWSPAEFKSFAKGWLDQGATIIGGCCGLGPDHIEVLKELRQ